MAKQSFGHTLDMSKLTGPPLQRILQLVCETGSPMDACSLLTTCKWIRTAAQHSCAGLIPIDCRWKPQQALAVAAWLNQNRSLARSLSIGFQGRWFDAPNSVDRQAAVSALALALQTRTSICLISSCCLLSVGPECVEILQQLPSRHLTSLEISLCLPSSADIDSDDQLRKIATALSQLPQLESVEVFFERLAVGDTDRLRSLLPAMSELSKLTSLKLDGVTSDAELRCLPTHLKELQISLHPYTLDCEVHLDHLTQLTELVVIGDSTVDGLCSGSTLPISLHNLAIAEFECIAALAQLSRLKDLSLAFCSKEKTGAEALPHLSALTALISVNLAFEGNATSSSVEETTCIWEQLPVRKLWVDMECGEDQHLAPAVAQHMTSLRQLTQLGLSDTSLSETSCEQFAVVLRQLTALQRLWLMNVRYQASNSAQLAVSDDSALDSTIRDAAIGQGTATTECEHAGVAQADTAASGAVVATADFEHVAEAIASLPDLCALSLMQQPITPKAAQCLWFCCGKMTELCLEECGMTDATLGCVLEGLDTVMVLNVSHNNNLTDGVLSLMQDHLQHVRRFGFSGTQITQAAVQSYLPHCNA